MERMQPSANPLGREKIGKLLARYAIPSVISLVINSLYNMVDQIFIGQGVGFLGNGATNIIAPITMIAIAAGALFGDGLAAFFSLHLGQGEPGKAVAGLGGTVTVSAVVGVLLAALSFLFLPQLCGAFGATENILPYALSYGRIIVLGFPAVVLSSAVNAAIRADGSPRFAMVSMMVGAVLNTILDPVFIFCFHWGVEGAALATILSQYVGLACNLAYLFRMKTVRMSREAFLPRPRMIGRIAGLGFASCFNNMTSTVVAMVSNNLLAQYGEMSVYGSDIPITTFGLCMKVSMLALSVGLGIAAGSQPVLGFNYGARKFDRVRKAFLLDVGVCSAVTLLSWVIFQCFPLPLIRIFGAESELYEQFAVECFRVYLMLTFLNGLQMCTSVLFQATGQPVKAAVASLSKQLLFYIPAMFICARIGGLTGILAAGPVADALAFILCGVLCVREMKKMKQA